MGFLEDRFSYEDFLDLLWVLESRAYGKVLAVIIRDLAEGIRTVDIPAMLRHLVRRGKITREGQRDETIYSLTKNEGPTSYTARKIEKSYEPWDRTWALFSYDISEADRPARRELRRRLHWMGFGMLSASSWLSPYDWRDQLEELVARANCRGTFSYIRAKDVSLIAADDVSLVEKVWNTAEIADRYNRIIDHCRRCLGDAARKAGLNSVRVAMWVRREMADLELHDPMLPAELLSVDWPRRHALGDADQLRSRASSDAAAHFQAQTRND